MPATVVPDAAEPLFKWNTASIKVLSDLIALHGLDAKNAVFGAELAKAFSPPPSKVQVRARLWRERENARRDADEQLAFRADETARVAKIRKRYSEETLAERTERTAAKAAKTAKPTSMYTAEAAAAEAATAKAAAAEAAAAKAKAEAEAEAKAEAEAEAKAAAARVQRCRSQIASRDPAVTLALIQEMAEEPELGSLVAELYAAMRARLKSASEQQESPEWCVCLLRPLLGHRAPLSEQRLSLGVGSLHPESKYRPWLLGGAEREGAPALLVSLTFGQAEQRLLTAMSASSDETVNCMLQLLGATSASLVGSESASCGLPDSLPRELSGRRRELLRKVVDRLCADVTANDGAAARTSHDRSVSLAALRRLLASSDLPKHAQHHALGLLGRSESEASLREIYKSLGVDYVQRWVNGQAWPPSASSLYLSDPSPLYTDFVKGLGHLPVANLSRLKASMRKLLYDFSPRAIPSGAELRPSGSVVVGFTQARHLRDAQYAVVVDMEYTSDKGENQITGGRRCWWEGSVRLVDLRTGKTVESLCKTKPKDVGLDSDDIEAFEIKIKEYVALGYKVYNFSKGADSRFITHCAGLKPEEYDEVAVDFRALLGALTTFFHDSRAPNSMDIGRHFLGLPGPTEWLDSDRAKEEELDADQGVPHRAPMDTWQMGYEVYVLHLLLADPSLPMWQLPPTP